MKINNLTREQVFEAVGFLGDDINVDIKADDQEANALTPLNERPYEKIEDLEQFARITLVVAAMNPDYVDAVKDAIYGSGKKQFVLGGTEIVALSVIALGALHVIITKGKTSEKQTIEIGENDGRVTVKIEKKVTYGISRELSQILKSIL